MLGRFKIFAIQPLGSVARDGVVPLNRVPPPLIELFLNKSFSRGELEDMGVRWRDAHALYSFRGASYLLNLTTDRWQ